MKSVTQMAKSMIGALRLKMMVLDQQQKPIAEKID